MGLKAANFALSEVKFARFRHRTKILEETEDFGKSLDFCAEI